MEEMHLPHRTVHTEYGLFTIVQQQEALTHLYFGSAAMGEGLPAETPLLKEAERQLSAYLGGKLHRFDLPLQPAGTPFQLACWAALCRIPYGEVRTYSQQAQMMGKPTAARAVGMANHRNPLPVFIPCHRVIGASGKLTGYAGGLELKRRLLELEWRNSL